MASTVTRFSLAQESSDLEPSIFATTQTAETDCLLGGKADSRQGQHQRARPARLGAPWVVWNGVPGKSGGDGAGDERALMLRGKDFTLQETLMESRLNSTYTYSNIVEFLELCIGPLFGEFVGFLCVSGVKEIGDGIVHGRPCCENDDNGSSSLGNEPVYNPAGTEKMLPPLRELLLHCSLMVRMGCSHWLLRGRRTLIL